MKTAAATERKTGSIYLRKIWASARGANIDTDLLHMIVERETGKKSLKYLTDIEARKVITVLLQNTVEKIEERASWLCSVKQEYRIKKMEKALKGCSYLKHPVEFRAAQFKTIAGAGYRQELRHTLKRHASQYIEILKSITERLNKKAQCADGSTTEDTEAR